MSFDQSILYWIHDNLSCGVLDALMPKLTLLGSGGAVWLLAAGGLLCTKKYRRQGVIPLAVIIAFSRLCLFVHYPSDILAGVLLGVTIGEAVYRCGARRLQSKKFE